MKNSVLLDELNNEEKSGLHFLFSGAIFSFFLLFLTPLVVLCQLPQGFNYQAIAREDGNPVITPIGVMLTIQSAADGGTTYWIELHSAVQPNTSGLFTIVVGAGVKQSGSTANTFNEIDWSVGPKFLKTEINTGSGFVTMGTSQFLSVPYSVIADGLGGALDKLTVEAPVTSTSLTEPLFEVKNNTGQTVFAVYNEGVRIYVDNGAKGVKGGFAIGGFGTDKAASQPLFVVNSDSIRAYIDPTAPVKGVKGGFAIGGFGMAKGGDEYLRVTRDSTRIYINDLSTGKGIKGGFAIGGFGMAKGVGEYLRVTDDSTRIYINDTGLKGVKGGFAIGGFDNAKGVKQDYLKVSPDSIRMYINDVNNLKGTQGGFAINGFNNTLARTGEVMRVTRDSTKIYVKDQTKGFKVADVTSSIPLSFINLTPLNSFIGFQSGDKTLPSGVNGKYNSFIGYQAGAGNTQGSRNLFLGYQAGLNSNASWNIFIGNNTGVQNTGSNNIFVGELSGNLNLGGNGNTFIGYQTGQRNNNGYNNLFLGFTSGNYNTDGSENVFLGYNSGSANRTGNYNLYLGSFAGSYNFTGSNNVCLGYGAGVSNVESDKLYIENDPGLNGNALIYGSFLSTDRYVVINGLANNSKVFYVNGTSGGSSGWATVSDLKLKDNIVPITDALSKVLNLRGVYFNWKSDAGDPTLRNMGMIAQEVNEVIPEVVDTKGANYSIQYGMISSLLVEAVKEQQATIESLKSDNTAMKEILMKMQLEIDELRSENK